MKLIKSLVLAGTLAGAIGLAGATSASALTLGGSAATVTRDAAVNDLVQQVQRRRAFRRAPVVRRGGVVRRGPAFRGRRGISPGAAAAIGLGIGVLGAAAAANAYPRECWIETRPVYNNWGEYVGDRNVRICN